MRKTAMERHDRACKAALGELLMLKTAGEIDDQTFVRGAEELMKLAAWWKPKWFSDGIERAKNWRPPQSAANPASAPASVPGSVSAPVSAPASGPASAPAPASGPSAVDISKYEKTIADLRRSRRNAYIGAGVAGALGLGGAGYGAYRAFSD